jgi:hypothetical protein
MEAVLLAGSRISFLKSTVLFPGIAVFRKPSAWPSPKSHANGSSLVVGDCSRLEVRRRHHVRRDDLFVLPPFADSHGSNVISAAIVLLLHIEERQIAKKSASSCRITADLLKKSLDQRRPLIRFLEFS